MVSTSDKEGAGHDKHGDGRWLALRFIGQRDTHAGMLVPPRAGRTVDVDWALSYGIFCEDDTQLARHVARLTKESVQITGAASACAQGEVLFEDYSFDLGDLITRTRKTAQRPCITYHGMACPWILKFKGQSRTRAGIAFDAQYSLAPTEDNLFRYAVFVRDVRDVLVWRAQLIPAVIPDSGHAFKFTTYYSDADIGDIPRYP